MKFLVVEYASETHFHTREFTSSAIARAYFHQRVAALDPAHILFSESNFVVFSIPNTLETGILAVYTDVSPPEIPIFDSVSPFLSRKRISYE